MAGNTKRRFAKRSRMLGALLAALGTASGAATAGGILMYEVGTADVGLAAAGYSARAQDASTVLTNPAGMTRLDGNQLLVAGQVLWSNAEFSRDSATSPALGTGGQRVHRRGERLVPGRRYVLFVQRVARPQARVRVDGKFRHAAQLRR